MSKRDRSVWFDRQKINKFTLKNEESTFCNSVRVDPEVILSIQSEFSQVQDTSEMTEQFSLRQMNTEPFEKRSDNCIFVSETETLETPIFGVSMPISDLVNQGLFEKSLYTKLRSNSNTNQQSGNNNFIHAHQPLLNIIYFPSIERGIFCQRKTNQSQAQYLYSIYNHTDGKIEEVVSEVTIRGVPDRLVLDLLPKQYSSEIVAELV